MDKAQLGQSWRFEAWINTYPLNRNTVLDYFKHSHFYDRTCNNEQILMQKLPSSTIKTLVGIEYEVENEGPGSVDGNYFVIRKQYRESSSSVRVVALFYIVGVEPPTATGPTVRGMCVPLPDIHSVFNFNLDTAIFHLCHSLTILTSRVRFLAPVTLHDFTANPNNVAHSLTTYQWSGSGFDSSKGERSRHDSHPAKQLTNHLTNRHISVPHHSNTELSESVNRFIFKLLD